MESLNCYDQVVVFGSFDLLHPGHLYFLKESIKRGRELTVVLARDEEILHFKGCEPIDDFVTRCKKLIATGLPTKVIGSDLERGSFEVIRKRPFDLVVLGDGQEALEESLKVFFQRNPELRIPLYKVPPLEREHFSSTRLRQLRNNFAC